ncbi:unnamed protein product [Onchocerca ochengi]|uniref:F-box domain-containing protein n=1 Tax=Onchocerca ochengi TaxID=42157 RepID=A0A182DX25_ONCOC|nr:unnamed protein product [Onchocerca ochengi]
MKKYEVEHTARILHFLQRFSALQDMSMIACTSSSVALLRISPSTYSIVRNLLRPRRNIPFRGIYKTEGDLVYLKRDRAGQLLLKAMTDGSVMITQEKINPDYSIPEMLAYEGMEEIYKLTFNVLPPDMSQLFKLLNEI